MSGDPRMVRDSTSVSEGDATASLPHLDAQESAALPRTRAGTAWVLTCVAAVALLVLIVFITQNMHPASVSFLGWHGDFPLAVALLAAALIGAVLTLILGSTRIIQLRRTALRARRERSRPGRPVTVAGSEPDTL